SPEIDTYFRARQPTDGRPVPVITTPRLAAAAGPGGILPVEVTGQRVLTRVVGTAQRFPSTDGDFVLADRQTVVTSMNADVPGSAVTDEIWIDDLVSPAALHAAPFDALATQTRAAADTALRA